MERTEEQISMEHIINHYLQENFSDLRENLKENNNSFIFLEKTSLNLLLTSLLSMTTSPTSNIKNKVDESTLIESLDLVINENKKEFESLLKLLRDITQ
ncbi:MAG: hypothetical protein ABS949_16560 [Solibacillus sp.]